jgi:hypothetical protein
MAKTNAEYQARHQALLREKADFFKRVDARLAKLRAAKAEIIGSCLRDIVFDEYQATEEKLSRLKTEFHQDDHL